ncbi:AAA family ATPase [Tenacibaculum ovolyticum]|uniref:AAA family ATPase n=1 Tax=Tenacibaculum ovolyticum TaxID=104270 RepID=UPI00042A5442|nr:AAA family ATPase [Tenacibaculum ovolyticum]
MKLKSISITNFRGIEELNLELDSNLNIIIGDNGSGKTAVLEAINLAIGSLFVGIQHVPVSTVKQEQIRILPNQEYALPLKVTSSGLFNDRHIEWTRNKESINGGAQTRKSNIFKEIGATLQDNVRQNKEVILPVIASYSSLRNNAFIKPRKLESLIRKPKGIGSRFRGYIGSLNALADLEYFNYWFISKELSQMQRKEKDDSFEVVKNIIIKSIPDCSDVFYDFNPDINRGVSLKFNDGRILPFNFLSDGLRSFFALISDLAWRYAKLNPHLGATVFENTPGIVLIDELDLHLHPKWQKTVLNKLLENFPKTQFIVTTHSPFLIQEASMNQLIVLDNCSLSRIQGASDLSIEDIAEFLQKIEMPQWSNKKTELYNSAKGYLSAISKGDKINNEDKNKLSKLLKPFSMNPAFDALLEQERIKNSKD